MHEIGGDRVMLRRRLAVSLVVLVGLVAGVCGWNAVAVEYETSGAVVVIPPGAGSTDPRNNPFSRLNTTAQFANVLAVIALGEEGQAAVAKAGGLPDFLVSRVAGDKEVNSQLSAQVRFTVRAADRWVARRAAFALVDLMRSRLLTLQREAGALPGTLADLRVAIEPPPGTLIGASAPRAALGFTVASVLAVLLSYVLIAGYADRRRRRRTGDRCAEPPRAASIDVRPRERALS